MRIHTPTVLAAAIVFFLPLTGSPGAIAPQGFQAAQQGQEETQGQEQTVECTLQRIDLDNLELVIELYDRSELTLEISEQTEVSGPHGEASIWDLIDKEGSRAMVRYDVKEDRHIAMSIELLDEALAANVAR